MIPAVKDLLQNLRQLITPNAIVSAWPLWALMLLATALHFWPNATEALRYDRDLIHPNEWYRVLTANLVHTNLWHVLLNVSSILVQWLLFVGVWTRAQWLIVAAITAPGNILLMHFFSPDTFWYVGMSGALYGTAVAGSIMLLAHREWLVGALLFLYLNGRVCYEQMTGSPPDLAAIIDAPVAIDAHLWGLCTGYIAAIVVIFGTRSKYATL